MTKHPIDALLDGARAVAPLFSQLTAGWALLGLIIHKAPEAAEGTLIGAGVGATIAYTVFWNNRRQAKRDTTLELFSEYYSAEFAGLRRKAEKFMATYATKSWLEVDPYDVGRDDENLVGYGAVLRYWQRVSLLFQEGELDKSLLQRLLARELAHWQVLIFEPVFVRKNIYVQRTIGPFVHAVANGPAREAFKSGERDGNAMKRKNTEAAKKTTQLG